MLLLSIVLSCVQDLECAHDFGDIRPEDACAEDQTVLALSAMDGDTVRIEGNVELRLLGVSAPEAPEEGPVQCFGDESRSFLHSLVADRELYLVFESECTDVYDRTLAWAFLPLEDEDNRLTALSRGWTVFCRDGKSYVLLNEIILREGYAKALEADASGIDEASSLGQALLSAASSAEADDVGVWGECIW